MASFPPSFIATILCFTILGLGLFHLAEKVHFALGGPLMSLDAICPVDGHQPGRFACDGGAVARRVKPYDISGAEQVRRFSANVSRCDFGSQGSTSWPPKKPILVKLTGWSAEKFRAEDFVQRFKDWRWPLSTFLRDPWLTFVGRQGDLLPSSTVDVSLEEYLELRNTTGRNIFLFLRDELQDDEGHGRAGLRHRFFQALEGELAPLFRTKLRIFAMDGLAAGHGMHRHKEAWLASLAGRKLWWVAPPHESSTLHGRPSFPYKDLTAEEGGWPCSWLLQEELRSSAGGASGISEFFQSPKVESPSLRHFH